MCAAGVRRTERILYSLELRRSGKHTKFSFIISLLILRKSQAKNLVGHKLNVIKSITRPQEFLNTFITRPHSNSNSNYCPLSSFSNCEQTTSKYSQFEILNLRIKFLNLRKIFLKMQSNNSQFEKINSFTYKISQIEKTSSPASFALCENFFSN